MLYNETLQSIDKRIDTVQADLSVIISEIHEKDSNSLAALQAANDALESLCTVREYVSLLQFRNMPNSSEENCDGK